MDSHKEKKPRIVIADDHAEIVKLVTKILSAEFEVVGSASNGLEAVGAVETFQPDVLVTDMQMPMMDGIRAARHLRRMECAVKIIFITVSSDPEAINAALSTNPTGVVLKSRLARDLPHAIRCALAGRQFVSDTLISDCRLTCQPRSVPAAAEMVTE